MLAEPGAGIIQLENEVATSEEDLAILRDAIDRRLGLR